MSITSSCCFCAYVILAVSQLVATAVAAGFSPPGGDAFGLCRLPLPAALRPGSRGRLAETMSEALEELRVTRVELTALREEMKSIQQFDRKMKAASSTEPVDANSDFSAGTQESADVPEPIEHSTSRCPAYGLGLAPAWS